MNSLINQYFSFFKLFFFALISMSIARAYLVLSHGSLNEYNLDELASAFLLGFRLDASVLAFVFYLPLLFAPVLKLRIFNKISYPLFSAYFFLSLSSIFLMICIDFSYFSFFGENATLMIFGVFDDDTQALINIAFENYNVLLVISGVLIGLAVIYLVVSKLVKPRDGLKIKMSKKAFFVGYFSLLIAFLLIARGSFGLFPLSYNTPDPTSNQFLNNASKSAPFALFYAYEDYKQNKSGQYDLIEKVGYKGRMNEAFKIHKQLDHLETNNLLDLLQYKTPVNLALEQNPPNVVVVMAESFGMPLLDYQSESFNIMGRLKKHFEQDTLFERFISSSNGTIASLEPLLLNITSRPSSTSFSQGSFSNTQFTQASARVYKEAGYETSFIYGGNLSWRNVGNFMSKQGFENVFGKGAIQRSVGKDAKEISHDWGVFDSYLYDYVFQKLKGAKKPQFIFVLTTNNHPPYKIPKNYKSNKLEISDNLRKHITGNLDLVKKRFKDYAYAVDMAGAFLDKIKGSTLSKNTVVAITADNNTVEGVMKYDDYFNQTKRIPFYLYLPEYIKPQKPLDLSVASSHKDIFPTLYNLTLSDRDYQAIGTNLLNSNVLHCGFNDAGIIMSEDGAFKSGNAKSAAQMKCQKYYKATLAVTEYLIQSQK